MLAVTAVVAVVALGAAGYALLRTPAVAPPDAGAEVAEDAGAVARFVFPVEDAGAPAEEPAVPDAGPAVEPPPQPPPVEAARPATLRITSEPPAEVVVDRQALGPAPVTAELPAGTHQVLLVNRAERFRRLLTVRLAPGETRTLPVVARQGLLRLEIIPFAAIAVNGEALGSASFKELPLYEGGYVVELELSDPSLSKPVKKKLSVQIRADETTLVKERMLASP